MSRGASGPLAEGPLKDENAGQSQDTSNRLSDSLGVRRRAASHSSPNPGRDLPFRDLYVHEGGSRRKDCALFGTLLGTEIGRQLQNPE